MYFLHSDNKLMLEFAWLELELRKVAWITWQTWSTLGCVQCSNLGWGRADGMMDAYLWKLFLIIYGLHFGKYGVELPTQTPWKFWGVYWKEDGFRFDFADLKHDYSEEFCQFYPFFIGKCPRSCKLRGVWNGAPFY